MAQIINLNSYKEKKEAERREIFSRHDEALAELGACIEEMEREERETGTISKELAEKNAEILMKMLTAATEYDAATGRESALILQ